MALTSGYDAFNPGIPGIQLDRAHSSPSQGVDLKSGEALALKDIGNIFEGAVKIGDEVVKGFAREDIRKEVEPEKYAYESALKGGLQYTKTALAGAIPEGLTLAGVGNAVTGTAQGSDPVDLTPKEMPSDLKALPNKLGELNGARASGKLSETDYYGRLSAISKDIRSRYPVGYREYIDKQIQEVTGVDPANAYIKSVIGDINSLLGDRAKEKEHAMSFIREHAGVLSPEVTDQLYRGISKGQFSPTDIFQYYAKPLQIEYARKQRMADREDRKGDRAEDVELDEKAFTDDSAGIFQKHLYSATTQPGQTSLKATQELLEKHQAGKIELKPEQIELMASGLKSLRTKAIAEAMENSYSYKNLPAEKRKAILEASSGPLNDIIDALDKKDTGEAYRYSRMNAIAQDSVAHFIISGKGGEGWKNYTLAVSAINKMGGSDAAGKITERFLAKGLIPETEGMLTELTTYLATPKDPRQSVNIDSLSKAIDVADNAHKQTGNGRDSKQAIKTRAELISIVDDPTFSLMSPNTSDASKIEIAKKVWNPNNWDFLRKINPDSKDDKGNLVPGYQSIYFRYTRPEVEETIRRLDGTAGGAGILKNYQDWVKTSFEQDIIKSEVTRLNDTLENPSMIGAKVIWDSKEHKLTAINDTAGPRTIGKASEQDIALGYPATIRGRDRVTPALQNTIAGINKGLDGYAKVFGDKEGDTDTALVEALMKAGVSKDGILNIEGLPLEIARSVIASRKGDQALKQQSRSIERQYEPR